MASLELEGWDLTSWSDGPRLAGADIPQSMEEVVKLLAKLQERVETLESLVATEKKRGDQLQERVETLESLVATEKKRGDQLQGELEASKAGIASAEDTTEEALSQHQDHENTQEEVDALDARNFSNQDFAAEFQSRPERQNCSHEAGDIEADASQPLVQGSLELVQAGCRLGAANQGMWEICTTIAISRAIAKVLRYNYGVELNVQAQGEALAQLFLSHKDCHIYNQGVHVPDLVQIINHEMNRWFTFLGAHGPMIRFTIDLMGTHLDPDSFFDAYFAATTSMSWVVVCSDAQKRTHLMHVVAVDRRARKLKCVNSYGSDELVTVPEDEGRWSTVEAVYQLRLRGVQESNGSSGFVDVPKAYVDAWQFPDESSYSGEVLDGCRHGVGKMTYAHSHIASLFEGQFLKGHAHGHGLCMHDDGVCYEGQFCFGWREGSGEVYDDYGHRYEGTFQHGRANGRGVYQSDDGNYEGNFQNGRAHGRGVYQSDDGKVKYDGHWENGRFLNGSTTASPSPGFWVPESLWQQAPIE